MTTHSHLVLYVRCHPNDLRLPVHLGCANFWNVFCLPLLASIHGQTRWTLHAMRNNDGRDLHRCWHVPTCQAPTLSCRAVTRMRKWSKNLNPFNRPSERHG